MKVEKTLALAVLRVSDAFGHLGTAIVSIPTHGLWHSLVDIESVDSLKCDLLKCLSRYLFVLDQGVPDI